MFEATSRKNFVYLGTLFEGGLAVFAMGLAWVLGVDLWARLSWSEIAVLWGVAAAVPMFVVFLLSQRFPVGPLLPIKRFLVELLGPMLAACRWYDLVILAVLAGGCEELLFRGVLQTWFERWGTAAGLIGSNILFGLAHLITPVYALLAGLTGVYLGLVRDVSGEPNLLIPSVTHAVYDFLAFLVVAREYRREQAGSLPPPAQRTNAETEDPPV